MLFLFKSTASDLIDCIAEMDILKLHSLRAQYDQKEKTFQIAARVIEQVESGKFEKSGQFTEFHNEIGFARERIKTILLAFGYDEAVSEQFSQQISFTIT